MVDYVGQAHPSQQFSRYWDAPTMDADGLLRTLKTLREERCGDPLLLRSLSHRFYSSAEEFFPLQIDELLVHFASLSYSDDNLLNGFLGRLGDVVFEASPRRVVRLLRNGAVLHLHPDIWLEDVLAQLHRQLPNLREGLPSCLESLALLRVAPKTPLAELLLTQGLLVEDELGPGFFTRLFERWSLHHLEHAEAQERAVQAASRAEQMDLRDGLNLLAGLRRCRGAEVRGAADTLEEQLRARLSRSSSDPPPVSLPPDADGDAGGDKGAIVEYREFRDHRAAAADATLALTWMRRLSLRSPPLWTACAEAIELTLKACKAPDSRPWLGAFAREHLPEVVHSLAALSTGDDDEAKTIAALLQCEEMRTAMPQHTATEALRLLHAACLVAVQAPADQQRSFVQAVDWKQLLTHVVRRARQLTLPERRTLLVMVHFLEDLASEYDLPLTATLQLGASRVPVVPLPPLRPAGMREHTVAADPSHHDAFETLLPSLAAPGGPRGLRLLKPREQFAGAGHGGGAVPADATTPECQLVVRALRRRGWADVELRGWEEPAPRIGR